MLNTYARSHYAYIYDFFEMSIAFDGLLLHFFLDWVSLLCS